MTAYGFAFIAIVIAVYVIAHLAFFNQRVAPTYCTGSQSFSCAAAALNRTGILTVALSQSTGGTVNILAAACSTTTNSTTDAPAFGNVHIIPYSSNAVFYPPNSMLTNTLVMYSGSQTVFSVYCYDVTGKSHGSVGNSYTGYLWLNYTYSNLPSSSNTIQRILAFSTKYN